MKCSPRKIAALVLVATIFFGLPAPAQNLDQIGVTLLRAVTTNVNGSGIRVAQPEAMEAAGTTNFEVNPSAVGQSAGLFTYTSSNGSTNNFPNALGAESGHADGVAGNFYGMGGGVATNVAHMDNYDADYFYNNIIAAVSPPNINDPVVNQSFIFGNVSTNIPTPTNYLSVSDQQQIDSDYDNYASHFKTLFVSGAGNSGPVCPVATCYNGIGVAAYGGSSSFGPTLDNGRAKPDITAPAGVTSFSTPQVAGAAAVLIQAGLRGDGGGDTNSAADIRTVKAFLLNGAIKPADWTNNAPSPLDTRYGAGVLNVFNSYQQLVGGKHGYIVSTTVSAGGAHPPTGATGTVGVLSGWDFNTNSSSATTDGVNHYYFNVTNGASNAPFTVTATLVWNRQQSQSGINNLDLFLYDTANSNLVACSTSLVDNVEHIFIPCLPQGRYDLQVWKAGGLNTVSFSETYAMAWAFVVPTLSIAKSATNVALTWPVYPAGFRVEAATNLVSPVWSTNNLSSPVITNSLNSLMLNATNAQQFFRLRQPDF
jgi:hypothetical protein